MHDTLLPVSTPQNFHHFGPNMYVALSTLWSLRNDNLGNTIHGSSGRVSQNLSECYLVIKTTWGRISQSVWCLGRIGSCQNFPHIDFVRNLQIFMLFCAFALTGLTCTNNSSKIVIITTWKSIQQCQSLLTLTWLCHAFYRNQMRIFIDQSIWLTLSRVQIDLKSLGKITS